MAEKVQMEGMTGTGPLMRVSIVGDLPGADTMTGFLRSLATSRINMRLFIGAESGCGVQATCSVSDADAIRTEVLADSIPELKRCTERRGAEALVSIFPHRFNLQTVGLALMALAEARLPMYGLCSSLSALTFITDHARIQEVFAVFQATFDFSNNPPRLAG
jgi:hypothetical protein